MECDGRAAVLGGRCLCAAFDAGDHEGQRTPIPMLPRGRHGRYRVVESGGVGSKRVKTEQSAYAVHMTRVQQAHEFARLH